MSNTYWLVSFVALLALGGAYLVWRAQTPPAGPVPPVTLPGASAPAPELTYYCTGGKTIHARFRSQPAAVDLTLSDGRTFSLPQAMSGSGIRYEATSTRYGTDVAFIGKGDNGFLTENDKTTYADCTAALVVDSDAPGYALYTDVGKTFTFAFPQNISVAGSAVGLAPGWSANETTSGLALATLEVPASFAEGTNFIDARFTVGASSDPGAVKNCTSASNGASATPTKLGDMPVTMLTLHDAAAGNRYDTTSYRVVHNDECYAVEYTVHYGAIENYPKGSVKEFDESAVTSALDEVAKSFQFLK